MKRPVRRVTKVLYGRTLKPLLFRRHPDKVHVDIIRLSRWTQQVAILRYLPKVWAKKPSQRLAQTILGVHFANPVGLSAGFDKNIEIAPTIKSVGFGFMTGGSITARHCAGNKGEWFHRLPNDKSLVVHAGLPNKGVDEVIDIIDNYPRKVFAGFPLIVSVAKTNDAGSADEASAVDDYCESLIKLEQSHHPAIYEVNISCPNTHGGEPFTTADRLDRLLSRIDKLKLSRPIIIKMPIGLSWSQTSALLDVMMRHQVAGVTIGNLLKDRRKADLTDKLSDDIKGGLSGLPTRDISTELIRKTHQHCGDKLVIIGVGGIFSAEDAYAKIRAGATLVGLITGMIFEGPQLIGDINHQLDQLVKRDGFDNISQAVGVDA